MDLNSALVANGSSFMHNIARQGGGGAIYGGTGASVTLIAVDFESNHAEGGGAVALIGPLEARIERCLFLFNKGTDGGGIYSTAGFDATIEIIESVFRNNFAGTIGPRSWPVNRAHS